MFIHEIIKNFYTSVHWQRNFSLFEGLPQAGTGSFRGKQIPENNAQFYTYCISLPTPPSTQTGPSLAHPLQGAWTTPHCRSALLYPCILWSASSLSTSAGPRWNHPSHVFLFSRSSSFSRFFVCVMYSAKACFLSPAAVKALNRRSSCPKKNLRTKRMSWVICSIPPKNRPKCWWVADVMERKL